MEFFKVFQLASSLFQLEFWDFCRFFSLLVGPLQAFQLVFVILHGILNGQQVVSVGILGLLQVFKFTFRTVVGFLVGFWISLRFFHLASRLFQLVFVTFVGFSVRFFDLCRFFSWFLGFFKVFRKNLKESQKPTFSICPAGFFSSWWGFVPKNRALARKGTARGHARGS